jgi:hypothetical protein
MKSLLIAFVALMVTTEHSAAQVRPYVPDMTCQQAQTLISTRRHVVLSTSPTTYDRFVSEDIYCEPDAYAAPAFEPTMDNRQCMIGYYCRQKEGNKQ